MNEIDVLCEEKEARVMYEIKFITFSGEVICSCIVFDLTEAYGLSDILRKYFRKNYKKNCVSYIFKRSIGNEEEEISPC